MQEPLLRAARFLLACLLLTPSAVPAVESSTRVPGSENQWPMSGGPDGSWKVTTDLKVPTSWSVRRDENIRWKKPLPAGGQSGIAVWGDRVFLTINPPTDTPPLDRLIAQAESAEEEYEQQLAAALAAIEQQPDSETHALLAAKREAESAWESLLKSNERYQNARGGRKKAILNRLLKGQAVGQAYSEAENAFTARLYRDHAGLEELERLAAETASAVTAGATSADIVLLCLNADSGETLWSRTVKGTMPSAYDYGFSDSTTPCPATDGQHVWAINASGGMACFTLDGDPVWQRTWTPTGGRPFNKQFDSILYQNLLLSVEPPATGDTKRFKDWNYLHAFDKRTGKRLWVTEAALTHYSAPVLGQTANGEPAVLIGRGGPHGVPERPVGLSLISLRAGTTGGAIWHWEPDADNSISGWGALSTQHFDQEKASWFYHSTEHLTVNTKTGELLDRQRLDVVDRYRFDPNKQAYDLEEGVTPEKLEHQRHCNLMHGDYLYAMVRFRPFLARHNVVTGETVRLEVPCEIGERGEHLWNTRQRNNGLNSKGQRQGNDPRTLGDGFQKCFLGSPTLVNNYLYLTNALGLVYVVDTAAEKFDGSALVAVNDLGPLGETWSVNSLSFARGRIYHRTMKEIICIGE